MAFDYSPLVSYSRRPVLKRPGFRRAREVRARVPPITKATSPAEANGIILDSDVLSIVQRADGPEYEELVQKLDSAGDEVAVSIVSFEEQMRGWLSFIARAKSSNQQIKAYAKLRALLEDFITRPVLYFDQRCASELDRLVSSKVRIGTMDLKIAAISIAHDALLVSRNLTDFRKVPGLRVEDWSV